MYSTSSKYFSYSDERIYRLDEDGQLRAIDLLVEDDTPENMGSVPSSQRTINKMWEQVSGGDETLNEYCREISQDDADELVQAFWSEIDRLVGETR